MVNYCVSVLCLFIVFLLEHFIIFTNLGEIIHIFPNHLQCLLVQILLVC